MQVAPYKFTCQLSSIQDKLDKSYRIPEALRIKTSTSSVLWNQKRVNKNIEEQVINLSVAGEMISSKCWLQVTRQTQTSRRHLRAAFTGTLYSFISSMTASDKTVRDTNHLQEKSYTAFSLRARGRNELHTLLVTVMTFGLLLLVFLPHKPSTFL